MKIIDKNINNLIDDKLINSKFISIKHNSLKIRCEILDDSFYLDSFNFFPITKEYNTFNDVFNWGDKDKFKNFYSKEFIDNFKKNKNSFKNFSDLFILGSSHADNYYRNLITFLPRIFFLHKNKVKLAIHRNSSNKFRNIILKICRRLQVQVQFVFLDHDFSLFENSQIPQFLNVPKSIKILNNMAAGDLIKKEKIYLSRTNSAYRNLINESDIIGELKKRNFRIVDLNNLEIWDQIKLFKNADVVISPTGSSLANIAFCSPGTRIIEISPKYKFGYEDEFRFRYSYIASKLKLSYLNVEADPVEISKKNYKINVISSKVLKESNYYKNLILKINNLKKALDV